MVGFQGFACAVGLWVPSCGQLWRWEPAAGCACPFTCATCAAAARHYCSRPLLDVARPKRAPAAHMTAGLEHRAATVPFLPSARCLLEAETACSSSGSGSAGAAVARGSSAGPQASFVNAYAWPDMSPRSATPGRWRRW